MCHHLGLPVQKIYCPELPMYCQLFEFSRDFPSSTHSGRPASERKSWNDSTPAIVRRTLTQAVAIRSAFRCAWGFLVAPVVWRAPCTRSYATLHVEGSGVFWYLRWHVSPAIRVKIVSAYNSRSEQIYDGHYSFLDSYVSSFYARFLYAIIWRKHFFVRFSISRFR